MADQLHAYTHGMSTGIPTAQEKQYLLGLGGGRFYHRLLINQFLY